MIKILLVSIIITMVIVGVATISSFQISTTTEIDLELSPGNRIEKVYQPSSPREKAALLYGQLRSPGIQ